MLLINWEINLILTWSWTCVITNSTGKGTFTITDARLYVPVVTFSQNCECSENLILKEQLTGKII